jgi:hypothetical protein
MRREAWLALAWPAVLAATMGVGPTDERHTLVAAPLKPAADRDLRTYRFTARVTGNGGVTPFQVGAVVKGAVTYDLRGTDRLPAHKESGRYESERNSLSARVGDLEFGAAGGVWATTGAFDSAETFQVVAFDLTLPAGWDMDHTNPGQSYGVVLQNAPPRKALAGKGLPDQVRLADFKDSRELQFDFFGGVKFPGGEVKGRATVRATVEEFEEVGPASR